MKYKFLNFKLRKIVHYSLILCILLVQVIIAVFFYNEFTNEKKLKFIESQLKDSKALGGLTENSRRISQKHRTIFKNTWSVRTTKT